MKLVYSNDHARSRHKARPEHGMAELRGQGASPDRIGKQ
jgi:hypothetical protein